MEDTSRLPGTRLLHIKQTTERLYNFISSDEKTIFFKLHREVGMFRSLCVMPFTWSMSIAALPLVTNVSDTPHSCCSGGSGWSSVEVRNYMVENLLENRSIEEKVRLTENRTFETVDIAMSAKDTYVLGSQIVHKIKPVENKTRYKSEVVAQNYGNDEGFFIAP